MALLLGLRDGDGVMQSGPQRVGPQSNESTSSIFKNLYSAMVNGNNAKPQGSRMSTTAPYQPLNIGGHQRSNSFSNSSLQEHSPASGSGSGSGIEDEHPQRLLDQWLSANSSMAIGHPSDADVDARVLGQAYGLFGGLNQPLLGISAETMGNGWGLTPGEGLNHADPLLEEDIPHEQRPQQDIFHTISHRMAGVRAEDGLLASGDSALDVTGLSSTVAAPEQAAPDIGNPLDDTYWNTLIDGESQRSEMIRANRMFRDHQFCMTRLVVHTYNANSVTTCCTYNYILPRGTLRGRPHPLDHPRTTR